ncbi:MAG TPA: glutamine synthetase type III [Eubacterium sp.]|nr:glutamine synthetase type III [Eubacterium sp.]
MKTDVPSIFGSMVFNDQVMKDRLPKDIYKALKRTMEMGKHLDLDVANVVASAMKEWAVENGATHFTHWFQPMTGITAEKHDSFISPEGSGKVIMEFSGKELVKGESDASSFPSGGLRATFEARGYTAWDPSSYAFLKDGSLCIPTAFCSYGGEALDKKTPLLRSMQAIDKQAKRILKLFGQDDVKRVTTTVGAEQEYFLIDKKVWEERPDLIYCGRTLFGCKPPKGQDLEDHYFGAIKPRVSAFMKELDEELWKLGILAKTKHNEVAPAQHELAPIFCTTNLGTDQNQLMMEMMKKIANKHGLVCLLHEKPFASVNGSGKHNNWAMATDKGQNLLEPGDTPSQNAQFLLFLVAVIKAVDEYQDMLRASVATAGNDHRLGAQEAPPAVISIFLGDELAAILDSIENGSFYEEKEHMAMETGAKVLPHFPKDSTDRNRTSPFAFTGNKFEFRMPGASISIGGPNTILNAIVAEALDQFATELEGAEDFDSACKALIKKNITEHKRILFNGNGYDDAWIDEAKKRGLSNLKSAVDALPCFIEEKNIQVLEKHGVYTRKELESRYEILLENYYKVINIEALTMISMVKKGIMSSIVKYEEHLAGLLNLKKSLDGNFDGYMEAEVLSKLSTLSACIYRDLQKLEKDVEEAKHYADDVYKEAVYYRDVILADMAALRASVDEAEALVAKEYWFYPSYEDILYSVQ